MPNKMLYHGTVFILTTAIVCVQIYIRFTQAVVLEEVDPVNNGIGTLTTVTCFIGEEVDLLWKRFRQMFFKP